MSDSNALNQICSITYFLLSSSPSQLKLYYITEIYQHPCVILFHQRSYRLKILAIFAQLCASVAPPCRQTSCHSQVHSINLFYLIALQSLSLLRGQHKRGNCAYAEVCFFNNNPYKSLLFSPHSPVTEPVHPGLSAIQS